MDAKLELQDIIDERITKTEAILDCLLAVEDSQIALDRKTIYNTIWAAHDLLREVITSQDALAKAKREH